MQIANLQRGGSSTAQPAHKPLQAPISRRDTGAGGACLKVFYGRPQESPWPSTARHGGQQCQPGSTGAARSAPWECRILCPDQVCVARGETPAYTPSKQPHPCQASAGCFEAFLEKTESLQPTLGRLSLRPPAQLPCPRCPHQCLLPSRTHRPFIPADVWQRQQQRGAVAPAMAHGGAR